MAIAQIVGPDGLILIVVFGMVLLFGGSKLPKLARGLGSASQEFRKGLSEGDEVSSTRPEGSSNSGSQESSAPSVEAPQ